ncbi:hypothetical protein ACEQ103284_03605 [Actinobacillus equuli subsp. equuli]|uniref:Uncharacterized protein n=1 Tax=Actinobacillus equuli TaxID=718 RepID=A0AAX3FGP0_ACTEU|nr:Uncharacterised protein [Actinobacillus equuli]
MKPPDIIRFFIAQLLVYGFLTCFALACLGLI